MERLFRKGISISRGPVFLVLVVSLFLLGLTLSMGAHVGQFSSDEVSWQVILFTWHPFSGHSTITLGSSDNFVFKIPIIYILGLFLHPSRQSLLIESILLAGIMFILFYVSALYFLKRKSVKLTYTNLLPFVWLSSFGLTYTGVYLNPLLRNVELGIGFVVFMAVAWFYARKPDIKSRPVTTYSLLLSALSGVLMYSDPYFMYFFMVPLALFCGVLYLYKRIALRQLGFLYGGIVIGLIFYKVTKHLSRVVGISMPSTYPLMTFVSLDQLPSHIMLTLEATLNIFGANFFGEPVLSPRTFCSLINAALLGFIIYKLCTRLKPLERIK